MHGWIGVCVKSRLLYDNASSCWVLMHHCSSGYPAVKDIPISQGKLARNNLPDHLEYFCVLICLWNCTSVCMCANMYKLTSICFQHLRAITYPPAKFGISAEIVPAFCIVIYLFILKWQEIVWSREILLFMYTVVKETTAEPPQQLRLTFSDITLTHQQHVSWF